MRREFEPARTKGARPFLSLSCCGLEAAACSGHRLGNLSPADLFFWKHHAALEALKEQELEDARIEKIGEQKAYISQSKAVVEAEKPRLDPEELLPGYMHKLVGGCRRQCTRIEPSARAACSRLT